MNPIDRSETIKIKISTGAFLVKSNKQTNIPTTMTKSHGNNSAETAILIESVTSSCLACEPAWLHVQKEKKKRCNNCCCINIHEINMLKPTNGNVHIFDDSRPNCASQTPGVPFNTVTDS